MPKEQLIKSNQNRITIRVWSSSKFDVLGSKRIGHVSLQTYGEDGIYASFWPGMPTSLFFNWRKITGVRISNFATLEQDINTEGSESDIIVDLYSLDVKKINDHFKKFKASGCRWALLGSSFIAHPETQNCSGLVYSLLSIGGIKSLSGVINRIDLFFSALTMMILVYISFLHNKYSSHSSLQISQNIGAIFGLGLTALGRKSMHSYQNYLMRNFLIAEDALLLAWLCVDNFFIRNKPLLELNRLSFLGFASSAILRAAWGYFTFSYIMKEPAINVVLTPGDVATIIKVVKKEEEKQFEYVKDKEFQELSLILN